MKLSAQELELEAKALLRRAARIEHEATLQREQARRFIEHLSETMRTTEPEAPRT